jgi:hypothetical protein
MTTINSWLLQGEKDENFLISDIAKHGCAGGIGGLIYYSETASFYDEHEDEIWTILSDEADAAGIANGLMLYNICKEPTSMRTLKNDLVWFAVQVAAQHLEDNLEEELRDPVTQQEVPRC